MRTSAIRFPADQGDLANFAKTGVQNIRPNTALCRLPVIMLVTITLVKGHAKVLPSILVVHNDIFPCTVPTFDDCTRRCEH